MHRECFVINHANNNTAWQLTGEQFSFVASRWRRYGKVLHTTRRMGYFAKLFSSVLAWARRPMDWLHLTNKQTGSHNLDFELSVDMRQKLSLLRMRRILVLTSFNKYLSWKIYHNADAQSCQRLCSHCKFGSFVSPWLRSFAAARELATPFFQAYPCKTELQSFATPCYPNHDQQSSMYARYG